MVYIESINETGILQVALLPYRDIPIVGDNVLFTALLVTSITLAYMKTQNITIPLILLTVGLGVYWDWNSFLYLLPRMRYVMVAVLTIGVVALLKLLWSKGLKE